MLPSRVHPKHPFHWRSRHRSQSSLLTLLLRGQLANQVNVLTKRHVAAVAHTTEGLHSTWLLCLERLFFGRRVGQNARLLSKVSAQILAFSSAICAEDLLIVANDLPHPANGLHASEVPLLLRLLGEAGWRCSFSSLAMQPVPLPKYAPSSDVQLTMIYVTNDVHAGSPAARAARLWPQIHGQLLLKLPGNCSCNWNCMCHERRMYKAYSLPQATRAESTLRVPCDCRSQDSGLCCLPACTQSTHFTGAPGIDHSPASSPCCSVVNSPIKSTS